MYIDRKLKQDKMLKLNMQHTSISIGTSINFKNSELQSQAKPNLTELLSESISCPCHIFLKNLLTFVNGRLVCLLETLRHNVNDTEKLINRLDKRQQSTPAGYDHEIESGRHKIPAKNERAGN